MTINPLTNGDRIRQMSDAELADLLNGIWSPNSEDPESYTMIDGVCFPNTTDNGIEEWLQSPVEGGAT